MGRWCIGCDELRPDTAMRWRDGEFKCEECFGLATKSPGVGWRYVTGVSRSGRTFRAWLPPKGSDDKPIFF